MLRSFQEQRQNHIQSRSSSMHSQGHQSSMRGGASNPLDFSINATSMGGVSRSPDFQQPRRLEPSKRRDSQASSVSRRSDGGASLLRGGMSNVANTHSNNKSPIVGPQSNGPAYLRHTGGIPSADVAASMYKNRPQPVAAQPEPSENRTPNLGARPLPKATGGAINYNALQQRAKEEEEASQSQPKQSGGFGQFNPPATDPSLRSTATSGFTSSHGNNYSSSANNYNNYNNSSGGQYGNPVPPPMSAPTPPHSATPTTAPGVSQKLFDKMRVAVEEELRRSGQLGAPSIDAERLVQSKLEGILKQEMVLHTCPVCVLPMLPPQRTPTMLVPCGHSFCGPCIEKNASAHKQCPQCRAPIDTWVVNRTLTGLMSAMADSANVHDAQSVVSGAHDHAAMYASSSMAANQSGAASTRPVSHSGANPDAASRFGQQLVTAQTRVRILQEEVRGLQQEDQQLGHEELRIAREKEQLALNVEAMKREVERLQGLIAQAGAQATELDAQLEEAKGKRGGMGEKVRLVQRSMEAALKDVQKYSVLVRGQQEEQGAG